VARYLLQRLLTLLVVVFLVSVFCFLLVKMLPGDPVSLILGPSGDPSQRAAINKLLGLDRPLALQYWTWLTNVVQLNFGNSPISGQAIAPIIGRAYRLDFEIIILSQIFAFLIAIPLAVYASRRPGGALDSSATTVTFAFYCLPAFILIIWFVQLFTQTWHLLPGPGSDPYPVGGSLPSEVWTNLRVLFLPAIVVSIGSIALYYRLLRSEMGATLQEEFIAVARAKGLTTRRILWRHALRPSSVPVLTSMGNNIALLLTALFIVEDKMGLYSGAGYNLVAAISQKDYLLIQAMALVIAITVVIVNFAIDLITTFVDPRIARA
jgi:peptide/nickel transport system permease protein